MELVSGQLTVYFENPFWVGVFERVSDGKHICMQSNFWNKISASTSVATGRNESFKEAKK